jgi:MFS family permease
MTLLSFLFATIFGCGQLFVGPLSELYGRMPVYHAGNVFFIVCSVTAALSTNMPMLISFLFLNGVAITSLTLGPNIVGDVFKKEERGTAMSIAIALPLLGPFIAPIVGGYVAGAFGWRWTIWLVASVVGAVTLLSFAVFKETYKVKILQVKATCLRKQTGNENFQSSRQEKKRLLRALIKPMHLLFHRLLYLSFLSTQL